jgi:UbiD family decarboxylase
MPYSSLEDFIKAADAIGEVEYFEGADLELDVGCLTELLGERGGPMPVFNKIPGYPAGYRVCSNTVKSMRRFCLALDLPLDIHPLELLRLWREKRKTAALIPAKVVKDGPILECVQEGDDVNLEAFPAPLWHPGDGGRYIGTADNVIVGDPDQGWINVGVYRGMVQSRNRMSLWINPMKHGRILVERHWSKGHAAPVAGAGLRAGHLDVRSMSPPWAHRNTIWPALFAVLRWRSFILPVTGLPVPAGADVVVEGFIPPVTKRRPTRPFGEWPGYYTHQVRRPSCASAHLSPKNPIINGAPPLVRRWVTFRSSFRYGSIWTLGVSDVTGVWGFFNGLITVIALRQRYAGTPRSAHHRPVSGRRHEDLLCHRGRGHRSDQSQ